MRDVFSGLSLLQARCRLPAGLMDCLEGFVAHHLDRAGREPPDHRWVRGARGAGSGRVTVWLPLGRSRRGGFAGAACSRCSLGFLSAGLGRLEDAGVFSQSGQPGL